MKKYQYKEKKVSIRQLDGSYKYQSVYGKTDKELADKCSRIQIDAEESYQRFIKPKFKQVALDWNYAHEVEVGTYTYNCYKAPLKNLIDEFGECTLDEITPFELQKFINLLQLQGYAKHTIALRKIVASQIFDFAILKGYTIYNPTASVKVPKNAKKTKRKLPADLDIKIVKNSVDVPFGLFAYLCLFTGCRRGEALALTYEDINWNTNQILVNKVVVFRNGQPVIENRTKSESGIRYVPLLVPLQNVLTKNKKGLIFHNNENQPLTLSQFNVLWKRYCRITGVNLTPHQLRHAFATICFDAGLEEKDTAQIMGHSKIELTMNIYTHIRESRKSKTTNLLNQYLIS